MAAKIFRINYKSDFILTLNSDAGWMTPFCIKFWTGAPSQAFYVGWDGTTYTHCAYDPSEPTKLVVQFDDHHLPIGDLKFQIAYHFTVADFPNDTEDEVINPANITTEIDGETYQVMLDFTGETAPEIEFSLPAYANEAQRIANEEQRIAAEAIRIVNEESRIAAETIRQQNEAQRISNEESRVTDFAQMKQESETATADANAAATLANEKAQLAADKAALADDAATLANAKAQLAADKAALADAAATLANDKAALAQQKAEYAQTQGDYAKAQGDYAKQQGEIAEEDHERAEADHTRAESDHTQATSDHTQAGTDHTRAESDHTTASTDHTQAGQDHTRAESDHTRAESDHAAVELYVDSLGAFDISAYHATGGVLAKYADLTAALGTNGANIPDALRKGGMSVKFVLSSDNKYVRYNLLADSFTTDTTQWAIDDAGVYVDNPEFVYVKTDKEGKILYGVKVDGNFYFGAGCPQQVKDYIEEKISSLSLDEYEDIVAFLSDYLEGDDTLKGIIGEWNNAVPEKKISILGDSISTFNQEGYKIDGYAMYYPTAAGDRGADVTTVNDTWWMQVINSVAGTLEVNASYSGSTASSRTIGFFPRVPLLGNPDIIYVALGTNDSYNSVPIGEINFESETYDLTQFAPAYIKGMQDTIAAYPTAKIVCVAFDMGTDYQNAIKTIAEHYGSEYIYVGDISDVHPNKAEMTAAANRIIPSAKYTITDAIKNLSNGKVDKETCKSLIDSEYASTKYSIENPEYIEAKTDSEGKLLAGRTPDGVAFENVGFTTPKMSIDGHIIENIEDPEGRIEIKTDAEGKILSYRDSDGVRYENIGIAPNKIYYSKEGKEDVKSLSEEQIESIGIVPKTYNMPEYGTVDMIEETFYLTADSRYSDLTGVTLIQDFEDTQENAQAAKTLSYYYINATLKDNGDDTYSKYNDGVAGHDVKLDFYAASKVTKVDDKYYVTASLDDGQVVPTSIEVTQIEDVPPYKAWSVDKKTEHYCKVAIDFGHYLSGTFYVGVKYQGSSTLYNRKRNWRFTFYKNSSFAKKNKIKIGELVRLSGYNLKANWTDSSRVKEWILYRIILEIWNKRPIADRYPWDKEFGYYTGATGTIKGFPVKLSIGSDFYGMNVFSLKKDEKNYMLDGTDASGIFVCGNRREPGCWTEAVPADWDEEMLDEMSEDTARALNVFFAFINERVIYMGSDSKEYAAPDLTEINGIMYVTSTLVEGQVVPESVSATPTEVKPFDTTNIPERMDIIGFIDYLICLQVFSMWDSTCRNLILHSRADKKKFYPFFYDVDLSLNGDAEGDFFDRTYDIIDGQKRWYDTSLWQHIRDLYWDEMVNRYCELRNSVLNENFIDYLWTTSVNQIPDEDYTLENNRWETYTSKARGEELLNKIKERLTWLDENYYLV